MQNGQWYNYPDLINYLRVQEGGPAAAVPRAVGTGSQKSKYGFNEAASNYSYAPKS